SVRTHTTSCSAPELPLLGGSGSAWLMHTSKLLRAVGRRSKERELPDGGPQLAEEAASIGLLLTGCGQIVAFAVQMLPQLIHVLFQSFEEVCRHGLAVLSG